MFKRVLVGVCAFIFSLVAAGLATQMSSASVFNDAADGSTITTRTPVVGETVPIRTPVVGESVPTRTPVVGETIPGRTPTPVPNAPMLQISNFVDFAPGITQIIVKLNGQELVVLPYGQTSVYIFVPIGTYLMEIVAVTGTTRGPDDFLLAFDDVTFDLQKEYTAIIGGDAGTNQPTQIKLVEDNNTPPSAGKAKIRVGHFAPFDPVLANTQVDVRNKSTGIVLASGLSNIPFGTLSSYIELPADTEYDLIVTNSSGTVLDLDPISFAAGEIVTIIVNGGGANQKVAAGVISNQRLNYLPIINNDSR